MCLFILFSFWQMKVLEKHLKFRAILCSQPSWHEMEQTLLHALEETLLEATPRASSHRAGMTDDSEGVHLVTSPWPAHTAGGVGSSGKPFSLPLNAAQRSNAALGCCKQRKWYEVIRGRITASLWRRTPCLYLAAKRKRVSRGAKYQL